MTKPKKTKARNQLEIPKHCQTISEITPTPIGEESDEMAKVITLFLVSLIASSNGFAIETSCVNITSIKSLVSEKTDTQVIPREARFVPVFQKRNYLAPTKPLWFKIEFVVLNCKTDLFWQINNLEIESLKFWQFREGKLVTKDEHHGFTKENRYFPFRNWPTFKINTSTNGPSTIFLRFKGSNSIKMNYTFKTMEQRSQEEISSQVVFLIFLGLCIGLTIFNLYLYVSTKDTPYLYYVGFVSLCLIMTSIYEGNLDWLIPIPGSWVTYLNTSVAFVIFLRIACVRDMLPLDLQAPQLDRALNIYGKSAVAIGLLDLIPPAKWIVNGLMIPYVSLTTFICLGTAILSYSREFKAARYMIVAWSIGAMLIALKLLTNLGQIHENFITDHAFKFAISFELMCLAMVLANKINTLQKELSRLNESLEKKIENRTKQLKQANKKYQQNQAYVIEQEKFAALGRIADALAHEVNTPLMIIRTGATILSRPNTMSEDMIVRRTEQIERAVDKIEKIIKALTITYLNPITKSGKEVSIKDFLQSIIDLHHGLCVQHEINLSTQFPEGITIPGNPLHLADIISEVLVASISAVSNLEAKWIEMNVVKVKNDIVVTVKDSCTDNEKDPRNQLYENIESMGSDKPLLANTYASGVTLGIAHQVIRSYGGTLKFIQNSFYSLTTIKFPIDIENRRKKSVA